jgi:tetratricopeptide (TPR) repeat protein
MLGQVALAQKDYEQAQLRYGEAAVLAQEHSIQDGSWDNGPLVLGLAQLAGALGKPQEAAKLFGAAHLVVANPHLMLVTDRGGLDRDIAAARAQLGDAGFAAAFAQGQAMTMKQALAYALQGMDVAPIPA